MTALIVFVIAYFFGGIPWAYVIAKAKGVDIRRQGSGNIGATNVTRVLGKRYGVLCFFLDFAKGLVPVLIVKYATTPASAWLIAAATLGAVLGHIKSPYLRFKGGKGVSTAAGALMAITPPAAVLGFILWGVVFRLSGYVSLASVVAACALPFAAWAFSAAGVCPLPAPVLFLLVIVALIAIAKHQSNIQRLFSGTENRFVRPPRKPPESPEK